jgi:hypothetical protein
LIVKPGFGPAHSNRGILLYERITEIVLAIQTFQPHIQYM